MKKKKIVQMVSVLNYGDAIGNDVIAIRNALIDAGYETDIYTYVSESSLDKRLPEGIAKNIRRFRDSSDTYVIYHLSAYSPLSDMIMKFKSHLIIRYHNITPAYFWEPYNRDAMHLTEDGIAQIKNLAKKAEFCIPVSEFNKNDLISYGYTCPMEVVPILISYSDYEKEEDQDIISRYSDDGVLNIIFTGRIVPNKKIEDIILSFHCYHDYVNKNSRLFMVGSYDEKDTYYIRLRDFVEENGFENVLFTGHISFAQMLAYYKIADVYLCLSEHEGFCVPLVESMYFGVPIIAYESSAVGNTLGGTGILLKNKDPRIVSEAIAMIAEDEDFRNRIISKEKERLKDFSHEVIIDKLLKTLKKLIK